MSILHSNHERDHELTDKLTVGGFCALVTVVTVAIVIGNIHLIF